MLAGQEKREIEGFKVGKELVHLSHLQFTNDSFFI